MFHKLSRKNQYQKNQAHAIASVQAVEDALGITIPKNASLIRKIMTAVQFVQDHVVHFYHLHALDWVDVMSASKADPLAASIIAECISSYPKSSPGYFADVQKTIQGLVNSGQLGIFANGYWGHPAYKLPPEMNFITIAHYLEVLDWQKDVVRIHTIFGGKNPHPNYLGGTDALSLLGIVEEVKYLLIFPHGINLPCGFAFLY